VRCGGGWKRTHGSASEALPAETGSKQIGRAYGAPRQSSTPPSISVAVRDAAGKLVTESIIETKATTILEFVRGIRGSVWITFEEGTSADWLYDLLKPHVTKVIVCNPRKNALLNAGSKSDRVDARKLSDLLRAGMLTPVYHGENGVRTLRELGRSYITVTKDLTRVMNRVKALYRSWAIPCAGEKVYSPRPSPCVAGKTLGTRCASAR
jgi:hypothetical protein